MMRLQWQSRERRKKRKRRSEGKDIRRNLKLKGNRRFPCGSGEKEKKREREVKAGNDFYERS